MFVGILVVAPADGGAATLITLPLVALAGFMIFRIKEDRKFLLRLFVAALLMRVLLGTLIYVFHLQEFFGGDAFTYDFFGDALLRTWAGDKYYQGMVDLFTGGGRSSGWGMIYMVALALALCSLITLRFYVFYIVVVAVTAAFILGRRPLSAKSFARQFIIMITIGVVLAYFGVSRYASAQFETFGNLRQLQIMRLDAARSAQSGFGEDVDVSTPGGALTAIPLGFSYLLLAPFPWQFGSLRALITLPEMIVWWCCIPLLVRSE